MSSPATPFTRDEVDRRSAIDPRRSFSVRAPAGSGKTELLIQRFLRLLAVVERPEAIVAITFTRKAAGEMRQRIVEALRLAEKEREQKQEKAEEPHERVTRELAAAALARDGQYGWDLLQHPARLRVQTIDSLCMAIAGEMPWLARLGAMPEMEDDCRPVYQEAARRTVLLLYGGEDYRESWRILLRHLDNNASRLQDLLVEMLGSREQWIKFSGQTMEQDRQELEEALERVIARELAALDGWVPAERKAEWLTLARYATENLEQTFAFEDWPAPVVEDLALWQGLAQIVLTAGNEWRKSWNKNDGFPPGNKVRKDEVKALVEDLRSDALLESLKRLRKLPPARYSDEQWSVMQALLKMLRLAVAQLRNVFREKRIADFSEIGMAARQSLGPADNPTDLAFRMDSRIEHLLVDEFQDTSRGQFELLERLTNGWQPGDGRTLFLVGDPMQSIYRFRQADVGLFLEVEQNGLGDLHLEPLELVLNYRSCEAVVARVNALAAPSFPEVPDAATGAIRFTHSYASKPGSGGEVVIAGAADDADEARRVVALIQSAHAEDEKGSVAVLVRARTHLPAIVAAIKAAGLTFRAVDIDPLQERSTVRDLLALTRAMLHSADRISWLAILRAPWCGLTLPDLEALVRERLDQTVWQCLEDTSALTADGQQRVARLREVLTAALAERSRWPLRRWVERVWIRLGGPACLAADSGARADAADYLDRLESEQNGADLPDLEGFTAQLHQLFAQPVPAEDPWLNVMTIHKAKGLGFDTVILPGLGRPAPTDGERLALIHEWREEGKEEVLLAPISEKHGAKDPIYGYLKDVERRKARFERARLLYVAMTRARKRLYLLGHVDAGKNGPGKNCLLYDLWGALGEAERASFQQDAAEPAVGSGPEPARLHRLPLSWELPSLPPPVVWEGSDHAQLQPHTPTFEWAGESLRRAGTVVHAFLQRMPAGRFVSPTQPVILRALAHAGVTPLEIAATAQRVEKAFANMQESPRAKWILAAHTDLRCEYAVAGRVNREVVQGTIDRTFVDQQGVRWIVDFKTSSHEGGGLEEFLDEQQRRYRDQMERYARIFALSGASSLRLALYFPLLDAWREWTPTSSS